ncbi:nucleoside hydrolase [Sphaerisporangium siamense]|uniref:Inosine-uridine nucleoside N-ribohydrolase n=1 Tax=Sphaerisporangium siamense TaxID=795645 RepID=A0A7W7DC59_9ACTN|nr:nucleoside hydrolase [Sphaerisporangium siamense]MBB4704057.1 inosine-uridine nucleoside N-ribohydrolase [Sphaerisporangium siamense]GII82532.1 nucleoside hydrolase [Sphaerisporangium siamense]
MSGPRRVVVDTDMGIDDACALLYLAGRPEAEVVAVTSVAGNCPEPQAVRNIGYVTRLLGLEAPVARGAREPLPGAPPASRTAHGADGLGDVVAGARPMPAVTGESAAALLVRLAAERPGELDLLALGPLTNLALAARADPEVLTRFRTVVVMGGSGPRERRASDTNVAGDPAAARAVMAAPRRELVLVGVNVTGTALLPDAGLDALRAAGTPVAGFAAAILAAYRDLRERRSGARDVPLHDPLAAAILLDPGLTTGALTAPVAVLREDSSWRARPAHTAPGPVARVVTGVDAAGFVARFVRTLTGL